MAIRVTFLSKVLAKILAVVTAALGYLYDFMATWKRPGQKENTRERYLENIKAIKTFACFFPDRGDLFNTINNAKLSWKRLPSIFCDTHGCLC